MGKQAKSWFGTQTRVVNSQSKGRVRIGTTTANESLGKLRRFGWGARSASAVIAHRVAALVAIQTGSHPSAVRMWRYGG